MKRIKAEDLVGEEWAEWYRMSPEERVRETTKLWELYIAMGGSLDPEPDTQSPFFDEQEWREGVAHGWPGVRVVQESLRGAQASTEDK
jgi:hypothetical protein